MGRKNLLVKRKGDWGSKKIKSRNDSREKIVEKLISELCLKEEFVLKKKVVEYHHMSSSIFIIIYGIKKSIETFRSIDRYTIVTSFLEKLFNKKIELYFINLSHPYLDAQLLSQYFLLKFNRSQRFTHFLSNITHLLVGKNEIKGIRVEIKGLSGKMAMSKKLIKSIGSHQFNSSNSIIDYGFAKSFNKKGITGIKVWLSYSPILKI